MRLLRVKDYEALSRLAADIVFAQLLQKPDGVLGTVTGASPAGMYRCLAEKVQAAKLDLSGLRTVNTDEYVGLPRSHSQSYYRYLLERFLQPCGIAPERAAVPDGLAEPQAECLRYEALYRAAPPDLQILGIGHTGHIGFNEPDGHFPEVTHCALLDEKTVQANAIYFESPDQVPRQAISVGIGTLMRARRILLLISGAGKAEVTARLLKGPVCPQLPASILRFHPDVLLIADEAALSCL